MESQLDLKLNTKHAVTLGIDLGSTTAKLAVVKDGKTLYCCYERHFAQVRVKLLELVRRLREILGADTLLHCAISGSAGVGVAKAAGIDFVQEVFATAEIVRATEPETTTVIELGGEDAKIIFFDGGIDERMNGSCAGGTGAFIDQMATLLNVSVEEMDALSLRADRIYPIASRCGVFAKTDIQPLLNQGAAKENIAASIYAAVVNQTITGLAQGKKIGGRVMFLGGPLYFCAGLRKSFCDTLRLNPQDAIFPEYAPFAVALGAALYADRQRASMTLAELESAVEKSVQEKTTVSNVPPLFKTEEEYQAFTSRHATATVAEKDILEYAGAAYLGIDCGSTTTKMVLVSEKNELLWSYYASNRGNPVEVVREQLIALEALCGDRVHICSSAVTGYGEDLIRHAFHIDRGIVETMAHFTAARHFEPNVDFILDIGGQDIKCFKVRNNAIDSIMLNEACSSGCGSFIETFARAMGYSAEEFAKLGLFAKAPVDLGSRCTVFMNSSVKQAQKDGAGVEDISAGLCLSVVRNALYKVIRVTDPQELGEKIVVQGGTFYNNAVLRSFEQLLGRNVVRPSIAGLMGAYGAALYAKANMPDNCSLIRGNALLDFTYSSVATVCNGCGNRCHLTVNTFSGNEKYISGAKCDRGAGKLQNTTELPNVYRYKQGRMKDLINATPDVSRGSIGLPLALGMWELAPFWHTLFSKVGITPIWSGMSTREMYQRGQYSVPSDTVCYPAKLMHGHIEALAEKHPDAIFYPCLTYNVDEGRSQNHYNCPVVAYYGELLSGNVECLRDTAFLYPYLNLADEKQFALAMCRSLSTVYGKIQLRQMRHAVRAAHVAYEEWMEENRKQGELAIATSRKLGKRIMVLAGRPYHVDPEVSHAIDRLANTLGFVVVSEDSVCHLAVHKAKVRVLNQWTYHARLYAAAQFAAENADVELVQLVSFGCGIDAITTDEVRSILEQHGKLYTQIKIDEITNLGAVTIRLRSLLGALELSETHANRMESNANTEDRNKSVQQEEQG